MVTGADIINSAEKYSGVKYFEGNPQSPQNGFDCSGLVQRALADLGIKVARTTSLQLAAARAGGPGQDIGNNLADAQQGDILHYTGHEEIAIGDKGDGRGYLVFSESTPGTFAAVRKRTPWPLIGIVRYTGNAGAPVGGKPTPGGDPGQVSGQLVDIVPGLNSVVSVLGTMVKLFSFILDPSNWWRVALTGFGVTLLIIALIRLTK